MSYRQSSQGLRLKVDWETETLIATSVEDAYWIARGGRKRRAADTDGEGLERRRQRDRAENRTAPGVSPRCDIPLARRAALLGVANAALARFAPDLAYPKLSRASFTGACTRRR
jgi:hypothetical protein